MIRIIIFVLMATSACCQTPSEVMASTSTTQEVNLPRQSYQTSASYLRRQKKPREKYLIEGITSGIWVPRGNNSVLGVHPSIGLVVGKWSNQWLWEFEMEVRFGQTGHSYDVMYQNTLQPAPPSQYFGAFMGMHVGYGFINFKRTSIYLIGGFGYDGFDALSGDDTDQNPGYSINSFNLNSGLGIQHFGKVKGYWGFECLYNNVWYKNPGGTPLDGGGITIRFTVGDIRGL